MTKTKVAPQKAPRKLSEAERARRTIAAAARRATPGAAEAADWLAANAAKLETLPSERLYPGDLIDPADRLRQKQLSDRKNEKKRTGKRVRVRVKTELIGAVVIAQPKTPDYPDVDGGRRVSPTEQDWRALRELETILSDVKRWWCSGQSIVPESAINLVRRAHAAAVGVAAEDDWQRKLAAAMEAELMRNAGVERVPALHLRPAVPGMDHGSPGEVIERWVRMHCGEVPAVLTAASIETALARSTLGRGGKSKKHWKTAWRDLVREIGHDPVKLEP